MAYVHAVKIRLFNTRPITRSVGDTSRTDTLAMCLLQADSLPDGDELPTMGIMIDGLDDNLIVDTGSRLDVLESSETYIMGQDLMWHKVTGGAAG